jgi:hypothetical protein
MINVYDMQGLVASVEMIDGKMHVISFNENLKDFEDLRPRQAFLKACLKAKAAGLKIPQGLPPKSEWEPVSDQELYDTLPAHFGHHMWCEVID